MDIIQTIGVTRSFPTPGGQPFMALKGIDMCAPQGKLTILKGRSGSGKTTLMNILGALDKPPSGQVLSRARILPGWMNTGAPSSGARISVSCFSPWP